MLDIIEIKDGQDLGLSDSIVMKAANVLAVQEGSLEYAEDFGIDLEYFLDSELAFENSSFKSYCVQKLSENQVNVSELLEVIETLFSRYIFSVGEFKSDAKGLIS